MKKTVLFIAALCMALNACAAKPKPLVYFGDTLPQSDEFIRIQIGSLKEAVGLPEISGIACSRVTPGYTWMQSDDYESQIVAADERGQNRAMKVKFSKKIRWDWEDMSGGVYNGVNYLFIGAFGDNDETDGNYSIVYLEEPAITNGEITVQPRQIKFQYPGGLKHNAEALMYDNIDQKIFVITKVYYNVCQVFSLPFSLEYGDSLQTLTYVCDLGVKSDIGEGDKPFKGFHLVTGADISPDGHHILIKNHNNIQAAFSWVLYWRRQEGETVEQTLINSRPVVLDCYQSEWQGEAICWLDSNTFYTTSDSDGEPPIYKYMRRDHTALQNVPEENDKSHNLVYINGSLCIRSKEGLYALDGRKLE